MFVSISYINNKYNKLFSLTHSKNCSLTKLSLAIFKLMSEFTIFPMFAKTFAKIPTYFYSTFLLSIISCFESFLSFDGSIFSTYSVVKNLSKMFVSSRCFSFSIKYCFKFFAISD